jgi:alkanesulfonate monooxygenase
VTDKINMLAAVRCGEMQPIMLARTIATLDHMLEGRLTVNIISSDFPGEKADSAYRYQRSREVVEILKQAWTQDEINYAGEVYDFKGLTTDPARPYQTGGPLLYFGGYSPAALELCGQHCDVYLMWPEPKDQIAERMKAVNQVAEKYDRTLDYGLRVHVIVRDTEAGGAGVCRAPRVQARRRVGHADPRARARFGLARGQPPGPRAGTGGPVRLCRAASVDRDRARAVGLRGGAGGLRRPGAERDRGVPEDGHPRLHLLGLSASGGMPHFGRLVMPELKTCSLPG